MQEPKSVRISIFGEQYMIKGMASPEEVQEVAGLVDQTMKDIAGKHPALDHHKLAVLAALNIAYQIRLLKNEHSELKDAYDRQVQAFEVLNVRLAKLEKEQLAREEYLVSLEKKLQLMEEERTNLQRDKEQLEEIAHTLKLELERVNEAYKGAQEEIRELYLLLDEKTAHSS
ncbi:MAG: protein of unknown function DUF710 [Candidatus Carbobacillus altaicus]|uniref:Cell division protein ZapA n=1 Tax=Candidatus Carbonibacillus altaicus TaxID=2163959 RepID=A0A2R6Y4L3_9BACL|nr:MAG: protein of unknown function DUF710 [Candidatus Carbobacillus altaicus]